jgi:hypothetical protein
MLKVKVFLRLNVLFPIRIAITNGMLERWQGLSITLKIPHIKAASKAMPGLAYRAELSFSNQSKIILGYKKGIELVYYFGSYGIPAVPERLQLGFCRSTVTQNRILDANMYLPNRFGKGGASLLRIVANGDNQIQIFHIQELSYAFGIKAGGINTHFLQYLH